jgi:NADH pyrophosphatase NudC (nudix superfamily)
MNLETALPAEPVLDSPGISAGSGGSEALGGGLAVLDSAIYRDERWCPNCGGPRVMIEIFETDYGRMRCCQGCGDERFVRLDRTIAKKAKRA